MTKKFRKKCVFFYFELWLFYTLMIKNEFLQLSTTSIEHSSQLPIWNFLFEIFGLTLFLLLNNQSILSEEKTQVVNFRDIMFKNFYSWLMNNLKQKLMIFPCKSSLSLCQMRIQSQTWTLIKDSQYFQRNIFTLQADYWMLFLVGPASLICWEWSEGNDPVWGKMIRGW